MGRGVELACSHEDQLVSSGPWIILCKQSQNESKYSQYYCHVFRLESCSISLRKSWKSHSLENVEHHCETWCNILNLQIQYVLYLGALQKLGFCCFLFSLVLCSQQHILPDANRFPVQIVSYSHPFCENWSYHEAPWNGMGKPSLQNGSCHQGWNLYPACNAPLVFLQAALCPSHVLVEKWTLLGYCWNVAHASTTAPSTPHL